MGVKMFSDLNLNDKPEQASDKRTGPGTASRPKGKLTPKML
jgi:hypothetical protein